MTRSCAVTFFSLFRASFSRCSTDGMQQVEMRLGGTNAFQRIMSRAGPQPTRDEVIWNCARYALRVSVSDNEDTLAVPFLIRIGSGRDSSGCNDLPCSREQYACTMQLRPSDIYETSRDGSIISGIYRSRRKAHAGQRISANMRHAT